MALYFIIYKSFFSVLSVFAIFNHVQGQNDQSSRHYNRDGVYVPPNPGDRDYKTFTYNNRRYGQYQPNYYYGRGEPLDPRRIGGLPGDRGFPFDPVSGGNCKISVIFGMRYPKITTRN